MILRAVIFDLYGVLGLNGWQSFKAEHFASRPNDWDKLRQLGKQVDEGTAKEAELVAAVAKASGEQPDTVRYQLEHTLPNTPLLKYIEQLKPTYKIGLLSNASHNVFGTIFNLEQLSLFDAIVSSFHTGLVKPDPRMFMAICEQLGVDPEECLFVDDALRHLEAARALGMKTVQYESVDQSVQAIEDILQHD